MLKERIITVDLSKKTKFVSEVIDNSLRRLSIRKLS